MTRISLAHELSVWWCQRNPQADGETAAISRSLCGCCDTEAGAEAVVGRTAPAERSQRRTQAGGKQFS